MAQISTFHANWRIGTICYIDQGKIKIKSTSDDMADRVFAGIPLRINSLNQYLYSYLSASNKVIFKIVSIEENEKPLADIELGKYASKYVLTAVPLGEIGGNKYIPGVIDIPMIGSDVYACDESDLESMFRIGSGDEIGCIAGTANVRPLLDLDALFSSHLAILGNTGSGKSTSSRLLLNLLANKIGANPQVIKPESLFVVFDLHGDYSCLTDSQKRIGVRRIERDEYHLSPGCLDIEDWSTILDPSKRIQKPLLERAVKYSHLNSDGKKKLYAAFAYTAVRDTSVDSHAARKFQIGKYYQRVQGELDISCINDRKYYIGNAQQAPANAADLIKFFDLHYGNLPSGLADDITSVLRNYLTEKFILNDAPNLEAIINDGSLTKKEHEVTIDDLVEALDFVFSEEEVRGNRQARSYSEGLVTQLNNLRDRYANNLFNQSHGASIEDIITNENGMLVIDVSEVIDEMGLKLFSSYIARKLFERNRLDANCRNRPVYLIFDEAHRYIRESDIQDDSIFNRIAREGRKFGLSLITISQIPHELSKVVLSQTGAFFIHRIQNSLDLDFIKRNVPAISADQVARLPNFAPGTAVLLGSQIEIPIELQIDGDFKYATPQASMYV